MQCRQTYVSGIFAFSLFLKYGNYIITNPSFHPANQGRHAHLTCQADGDPSSLSLVSDPNSVSLSILPTSQWQVEILPRTIMGNSHSSRIPTTNYSSDTNHGEKDAVLVNQLTASLASIQVAQPLSNNGSLTLDNVSSWEASATHDDKLKLARTILSHSDIRSALISRSAVIADQHVFNNLVDFKTDPITNQKSSGRCWLFATTNVIRYGIMKRQKLKEFQLSQVRHNLRVGP